MRFPFSIYGKGVKKEIRSYIPVFNYDAGSPLWLVIWVSIEVTGYQAIPIH
jgi:hypothetical protein